MQRCSCKGIGSVGKSTVWLEDLFFIRIYNRDPRPHILRKQRLVGAGGEPFCLQWIPLIGSGDSLFLWFWAWLITVFRSFIPFSNFVTSKTNLSDADEQYGKFGDGKDRVAERGHVLVFCCHCHWSFCERLYKWLYQQGPKSPLEANLPPPPLYHLWSDRRP
jgi:hypothetical protein